MKNNFIPILFIITFSLSHFLTFSQSVGIGDTIGANAGQSSAYIFYKSSNGWIEQAKLTAKNCEN